ncbi:hypothetical protein Rrhod_1906 [Rhodococcus rhodnii LMG 5362]|uniref:Uncharacterized protein n=1 Tax=Rhodococcus rhodnii LMG 5362 TaxID=1273125 RepID=R7WN92_9NOCA|nr:hypothetical protein Rrhod_1906 [Rhodococcus rhodnii LMG 5362]
MPGFERRTQPVGLCGGRLVPPCQRCHGNLLPGSFSTLRTRED